MTETQNPKATRSVLDCAGPLALFQDPLFPHIPFFPGANTAVFQIDALYPRAALRERPLSACHFTITSPQETE